MTQTNPDPNLIPPDRLGTVHHLEDGRVAVRFERQLNHDIQKVWAAITDPAQREQWFPGFQLELRKGGHFEIWFGGECEGPAHVSGDVIECDPPRLLQTGTMRYELTPMGDGCRLVFSDVLVFQEGRSDTEITNSVLGGWHRHTDLLEEYLDGMEIKHHLPEFDYSMIDIPGRP